MRLRAIAWIDVACKLVLFALLAVAIVFPELDQFSGKAFGARAIMYPIAVLVVPAAWLLLGRRRGARFPFDVDLLVTLPFLIDVLGNAFDLYDTLDWWDDANHLVNWAILSAGFGRLLVRSSLGRLYVWALVTGFGAVTAILWELAEYVAFIRDSPELATAYEDTLGDLSLGTLGSMVAGLITVWALGRARSMSPVDAA